MPYKIPYIMPYIHYCSSDIVAAIAREAFAMLIPH